MHYCVDYRNLIKCRKQLCSRSVPEGRANVIRFSEKEEAHPRRRVAKNKSKFVLQNSPQNSEMYYDLFQ